MPVGRDSLEYSVMSYHSHVGATVPYYTNEQWGYPQSLMMYDIAALQTAYGANYTTNAGDTTYSWSAETGEMFIDGEGQGAPGGNRVFLTIWDGGGHDTYDFSNYATDLDVNLQPGEWTTASSDQLANLGNGHFAAGNVANALLYKGNAASLIEDVIGGAGNDAIVGNAADNLFAGGAGNDTLDGLGGVDTAAFSGNASDYSVVTNADGTLSVLDLRSAPPTGPTSSRISSICSSTTVSSPYRARKTPLRWQRATLTPRRRIRSSWSAIRACSQTTAISRAISSWRRWFQSQRAAR